MYTQICTRTFFFDGEEDVLKLPALFALSINFRLLLLLLFII